MVLESTISQYSERIIKQKEEVKLLEEQETQQKELAKLFRAKMNIFRRENGVNFLFQMNSAQQTIFKNLRSGLYDAQSSAISLGNRQYGLFSSIKNNTLKLGQFKNTQLLFNYHNSQYGNG